MRLAERATIEVKAVALAAAGTLPYCQRSGNVVPWESWGKSPAATATPRLSTMGADAVCSAEIKRQTCCHVAGVVTGSAVSIHILLLRAQEVVG